MVTHGMLLYGVVCAIGWSFLWWLSRPAEAGFVQVFADSLPLWLIGGYVFGEVTWWGTNHSYKAHFEQGGEG